MLSLYAVGMADTAKVKAKWQSVTDTWSSTKAKAILSSMPPIPLPTKGPLHKLLNATKKALPPPDTITQTAAEWAVVTDAVLVLGKLTHWMLQRPCPELMVIQPASQNSLTLHLLLKVLVAVATTNLKTPDELGRHRRLMGQLQSSGEFQSITRLNQPC
jgi:hypothetical protein